MRRRAGHICRRITTRATNSTVAIREIFASRIALQQLAQAPAIGRNLTRRTPGCKVSQRSRRNRSSRNRGSSSHRHCRSSRNRNRSSSRRHRHRRHPHNRGSRHSRNRGRSSRRFQKHCQAKRRHRLLRRSKNRSLPVPCRTMGLTGLMTATEKPHGTRRVSRGTFFIWGRRLNFTIKRLKKAS